MAVNQDGRFKSSLPSTIPMAPALSLDEGRSYSKDLFQKGKVCHGTELRASSVDKDLMQDSESTEVANTQPVELKKEKHYLSFTIIYEMKILLYFDVFDFV